MNPLSSWYYKQQLSFVGFPHGWADNPHVPRIHRQLLTMLDAESPLATACQEKKILRVDHGYMAR